MVTEENTLKKFLESPEGGRFEFKEAKNKYDFEELVDYCVALANEGGGKILLGVTDKRPRRIVGSHAFAEPGRTESGIYERLRIRIPIEEIQTSEGRVLVVHVPARLPGTAINHRGRYLKRAGDSVAALGDDELKAIFSETGPDFSAQICPSASFDDLEGDAIADFAKRWSSKAGNEKIARWSNEQTLRNSELIFDHGVTYAALILFGTNSALSRAFAQAEIIFEYRAVEAAGPASERQEFRAGFLLIQDALWQRVNLRNDRQSYQDGLFRLDIPTFDEGVVREALLNAVAHRDYRLGGSVFVRQYPRRLEFISPGGFPAGITADNILDQQNPRNRRLAEALQKCGLIERSGQGMNLMFERSVRQSKPLPSFEGTSAHEVRLKLAGAVENPGFVRFIERIGEERLQHFSTHDFLLLEHINRDKPISDLLRARLPGLIDAGAVESVGRGRGTRYLLSRGLYAAMGTGGTYTRRRGLDHETNKSLLEKHLQDCGKTGAPLAELRQVLPALSEDAVQRLLHELRSEARVALRGTRRWARWYLDQAAKAQVGN